MFTQKSHLSRPTVLLLGMSNHSNQGGVEKETDEVESRHTDDIGEQDLAVSRRSALKLLGAGAVGGTFLGGLPKAAGASPIIKKLGSTGDAVALDGDTIFVGVSTDGDDEDLLPENAGAVHRYEVLEKDLVDFKEKLTASDAEERDRFGNTVSLDGDTALIGAFRDSNDRGAAYVFEFDGDEWKETQKLTADDADVSDLFGISVGLDGDTAIIGASGDSEKADRAGAAYVFTRDGGSFTETEKVTASDPAERANLGAAVGVEGGTALLGAPDGDTEFFSGIPGVVYVVERSGGSWPTTEDQKLTPTDSADEDGFGASIGLDGETAVIGSPGDSEMADEAGAAYIFTDGTSGWTETQKLTADDADARDRFGNDVGLAGDAALIAAVGDDEKAGNAGAAYVFNRDGSWGDQEKLTPSDPSPNGQFGEAVAIDGTNGLVAAPGDKADGVVYFFPDIADLVVPSLQLNGVRFVQTVEETVLRRPGALDELVLPNPPDLVAGRNTTVLFNLVGSRNLDRLPDDATVDFEVTRDFGGESSSDNFELDKPTLLDLAGGETPETEIFDGLSDAPPVFEATGDLNRLAVEIGPNIDGEIGPDISADVEEFLVGRHRDIRVREMDELTIGFIEIADPTGGDNYGDEDGRIIDDIDDLVDEAVDFIESSYPVEDMNVFVHPNRLEDSSVLNTDSGSIVDDLKSARTALEGGFPVVDFDVTVAFVPGGGPPGTEEGYPSFHDDGFFGKHYPKARTAATSLGNLRVRRSPEFLQQVVAHEVGHHFLGSVYSDKLGMRTGGGKISNAHARTDNSIDDKFIASTGFDLVDGEYDLVGTDLNSFMSYNKPPGIWMDAHAYDTLLDENWAGHPDSDGSGSEEQALIEGVGRLANDDTTTFTRVFRTEGSPRSSIKGGAVTVTVLDATEDILDERTFPDQLQFHRLADDPARSEGVDEDVFSFAVPFPEEAAAIEAELNGTVTRLNPIERSIREAIARLPDAAFRRAPKGRRKALNNKLDELDEKMEAGEYRGALNKLEHDIRDKLEKWVQDEYETSALQPTKAELLTLVDEMIARLETLVQASSG